MSPISGKAFCRLLEANGWALLRIKGSHHIYGKAGERARITVPVHGSDALKRGLQAALLKMANLPDSET